VSFADQMESLKKFDVNDLDFNNAGSWPAAIKAIVLLLVFGLILGGGYWFMIKDQYAALERVEAEEATLKQQYEAKAFQVANLEAYRQQMEEMEESFGALLKQLPKDTEVPGLLEDITNTGLGTGLAINSIALKPEVTREFYVELPIDISVRGTYHDIASFVSGVAALPRIVTLHDFNIKPNGKSDAGELVMAISAKTYRYNPDQKSGKKKDNKRKKK
jgi:type IV pilus assembly protein PilO